VQVFLLETADKNAVETRVEAIFNPTRSTKHTFEQRNGLPREEFRMWTN
jgi:hypothetical protein